MIDIKQLDTLQLIIFLFDAVLVILFWFAFIKAAICIYNDLYKERLKKFFKRFVVFSLVVLMSTSAKSQDVCVQNVKNSIKVGALTGNKNLEFGVKNILEEIIQDKGLKINSSSNCIQIYTELIYIDVLQTKSNMSLFHKNDNAVVIRIKGYVVKNGVKSKEYIAEEQAVEESFSTLLISNDGKLNKQNLSTAIKKACESIVNKLI